MNHNEVTHLKLHYVCYDCRKTFKQYSPYEIMQRDDVAGTWSRLSQKKEGALKDGDTVLPMTESDDAEWQQLHDKYFGDILCPQCRQPMTKVGHNFQAPRKRDKSAWEELRNMPVLVSSVFNGEMS